MRFWHPWMIERPSYLPFRLLIRVSKWQYLLQIGLLQCRNRNAKLPSRHTIPRLAGNIVPDTGFKQNRWLTKDAD